MKRLTFILLLFALLVGISRNGSADIINGSFENGLEGFTPVLGSSGERGEIEVYETLGNGVINPTNGNYFLYLSTGPGDVEADGRMEYAAVDTDIFRIEEGIKTLSFDFNVLTEHDPSDYFIDWAWAGLEPIGGANLFSAYTNTYELVFRDDSQGFQHYERIVPAFSPIGLDIYTPNGSHYTKQTGWYHVVVDVSGLAGTNTDLYLRFAVSENNGSQLLDTALLLDNIRLNPETATISNTPTSPTNQTSATLIIGGVGVTHYRYKLDDAAYGSEIPVETPITLTNLSEGSHTLYVVGRQQAEANATTFTWTVDVTSPLFQGYPSIDFINKTIDVTYSEDGMQNATGEDNYSFSPSLNFVTLGGSDDITNPTGSTYRLAMASIPAYTVYTLTVSNVTDAAGNAVSPASIKVNDDDSDSMADDWESAKGVSEPNEDPDTDNLTNLQEFQNGTEPNDSDTDNDGMPDGWEVTYGLNPLLDDASGDADNDGYSNLQEYLSGTDPNDSNSKPQPPTADAGPDQEVVDSATVTLNGSNSSDPDDGIASYRWDQTAGPSVTLSDVSAAQPTFTSPEVGPDGESLTFQLTVTDNGGLQDTDTCIVNVTWENDPPTADAGPDQTIEEGVEVTLDGSNSTDPDDGIASYLWEQTGGPSISLSSTTAAQPTFTSPDVGPDGESLTFQLTVTDNGGLQSTDTCIVNVTGDNDPPVSDAGPDQTVDEGVTVTLDGSNSSDDEAIHRYLWSQSVGTPVTLSDTTAIQPTFVTPPVDSNGTHLEFILSVIDITGLQHTDKVSIDVEDNGITGFPADVLPTESSTGKNIGIKVESGGSITGFIVVIPSSLPDTTNMPEDFIYGLISMQLKPDTAGGTVKVTVYLANPAPEGYTWYKYGTNDGWYDFSDYAEFSDDRDQVTLTLTDGEIGDDDGIANGVIVDPSGLGASPGTSTPSGAGGGCFIATVANGSPMAEELATLKTLHDNVILRLSLLAWCW